MGGAGCGDERRWLKLKLANDLNIVATIPGVPEGDVDTMYGIKL